jgi:hypothetical protein
LQTPAAPAPGDAQLPAGSGGTPGELPMDDLSALEGAAPKIDQGIAGRVVDASSGEGMIEAQVSIVGSGQRTLTDLDGNFALKLPPGTYSVRSFYELFEPQRVDNIVVAPGKVARIEIVLGQPESAAPQEEFVVTARADRATDATQLQLRRESAVVRDAISAQEIGRSGSNNAADAIRRVVSATVDPSNRLIVRGLGSRYTRVLLHGFRIPSTDPDDPGVELDLFPAGVLSNLAVLKTFTPDLPGDFAGGIMQVETRDFPKDFLLQTSFSLSANTEATFRPVLDYEGGKLDWLGFDDGARKLPEPFPSDRVTSVPSIARPMPYSAEQTASIGRSLDDTWAISQPTALPNIAAGIVAGDTVQVGGKDLGYLAAFGYQYRTDRRVSKVVLGPGFTNAEGKADIDASQAFRFTDERGRRVASWGALGTLNYQLSARSDLTLTSLWSQSGSDETNYASGTTDGFVAYAQRRLRWLQREMWFAQVRGEHRELPALHDLTIDWNVSVARAARDEPDTRVVRYQGGTGSEPLAWSVGGRSPARYFSGLEEWTIGAQLDLTLPIVRALKAKAGGQTRHSYSDFQQRRFTLEPGPGFRSDLSLLPPNELFATGNIGPILIFEENTDEADGYRANSGLFAGYAMLEVIPFKPLRLIGGLRVESFRQALDVRSPTAITEDPSKVKNDSLDLLPGGALVYELRDGMFLRASYGYTVNRPLFRQLAPFPYLDDIRGITATGSPFLESSRIHNGDLRWELFPSATEVLAVTGFYKQFIDPIEPYSGASITNWQNAKSARNIGAELETRLGFERLHASLDGLSAGFNLTYVYSRIELDRFITLPGGEQIEIANTTSKRPLAGQSPYVINLSLGFSDPASGSSIFAYYNVAGKRIDLVGATPQPDVYEQPFHSLDIIGTYSLTRSWSLRFTGKNLLFRELRYTQGSITRESFRPGTIISLGAAWNYEK